MQIAINTLLRSTDGTIKVERIVWIDESDSACFIVDIARNAYPIFKLIEEIKDGLDNDTILIEETDPSLRIFDQNTLKKSELEAWDRAWAVIQYMVKKENEPNIFIPSERSKLIKKASKEFGLSEAVISKYIKRFYVRGMTKTALLPDYYKCGGKGKERKGQNSDEKKRGRPRGNPSIYRGMNVNEDIKRIFKMALDKHYYSKNAPSLKWSYEQMIKEHFATNHRVENGIKIPTLDLGSPIPSFGQFRYWFEKSRDLKKEVTLRQGVKKYEQRYRPVLGTTKQDAKGPGSLYQIDATIADLFLVSTYDRTKVIGRPTIYFVCDTYSRVVVGVYVGLENASWNSAMTALQNACESKVDYCRRFGIEISDEQWPFGLPTAILGDRGEIISEKALSMIENLNIAVKNAPPFRPDFKSFVEKQFDLIQSHLKPHLPGTIREDFEERGAYDYRLKSTLTLEEYTKAILKCIVFYNTQYHLAGYGRDPLQIEQGVPPIPIEIWKFGMKNHAGQLRKVSSDVLRFNLMPVAEATITAKGIRFKGIYYGSDLAINERWFVQARMKGTWKVDVSFDVRNVNHIYLRLDREKFEVCYLLESQSRYKDKPLDEVNFLHELEQQDQAGYEEKELGDRITLSAELEGIVAEAKRKTRAEAIPQSKAEKVKGIRENRDEEKQKNREQDRLVLGSSGETRRRIGSGLNEQADLEIDDIEILIKQQRERLDD